MKTQHGTRKQWLERVVAILNREKLTTVNNQDGRWTVQALLTERGDEPRDMHEAGDPPAAYAKFLIEEYTIFGPEGE